MRHCPMILVSVLAAGFLLCPAAANAEGETEITGFYQQYRDFSYTVGLEEYDLAPRSLGGGGFSIAQNMAPWFAMWTQFSFFGSAENAGLRVRMINNQQGVRYQTKEYGPVRLYAKGGLGFSRFSIDTGQGSLGDTKFSAAYGAGAHIWMHKHAGINLDLSHVLTGLPNLTDLDTREKWDSGLVLTTGLTLRF
ncbi:MAG: porin family protein [Acidobacteria bacterium]|nr:porin family protein [Acidobacteriota bacterium]